ncbi:MAG: ribosome assembly cofactor RimP [Crocinitomicaceae bacterium]|nr:ribosome assembly cofactor RimP [Crocinitomicaceae bacterium]
MIDKQKVWDLAEERIEDHNPKLYIVDLSISSGNKILVEIDNEEGGVSIEDCMQVSRNIEHNLDRESEDFELEVSSAGLTKPFRVHKQYVKNIGRTVKVATVEHGKSIEGTLTKVTDEGIVIEQTTKKRLENKKKKVEVTEEFAFNFDEIKETKLVITF